MDDKKSTQLLEEIKKLFILSLITQGIQAKDIAEVLGVNKSTIARIASVRKFKKS